MKIAVLSTPANLEVARQCVERLPDGSEITYYFKKARLCRKSRHGWESAAHQSVDRWGLFKDIRTERFDHFIVAEWPQARTQVLPYYALLALFSGAAQKSIVRQDGNFVPITTGVFIRLIGELISILAQFVVILPLLLLNLVIVMGVAICVDLICWFRSKSVAGAPPDGGNGG